VDSGHAISAFSSIGKCPIHRIAEKIHFSESLITGVETGHIPSSPDFAEMCDLTLNTGGALIRSSTGDKMLRNS